MHSRKPVDAEGCLSSDGKDRPLRNGDYAAEWRRSRHERRDVTSLPPAHPVRWPLYPFGPGSPGVEPVSHITVGIMTGGDVPGEVAVVLLVLDLVDAFG